MYAALSVTMYLLWLTLVKGMFLEGSSGTMNTRWRQRETTIHIERDRMLDRQKDRQIWHTDCLNSPLKATSTAHDSQTSQELEHVREGVVPVATHHSHVHPTAVRCGPKCIINLGPVSGGVWCERVWHSGLEECGTPGTVVVRGVACRVWWAEGIWYAG